ncbi:MAG TPA: hypothetical protein VN999_11810 [Thermoanaerobaculia bacterium]|nr:hypothetical protein [Thermoanaerobaculia bacterium]
MDLKKLENGTAANGTGKLATAHAYDWRSADSCVAPYEVRQDMTYDPSHGRLSSEATTLLHGSARVPEAVAQLGQINFNVEMSVSSSGAVKVDPSGTTKDYPSIEGYAYRIINGELVIQVLFKVPEQDPSKLKGPMNVPLVDNTPK